MEIILVAACFGVAFIAQAYFAYRIATKILLLKVAEGSGNLGKASKWLESGKKNAAVGALEKLVKGTKKEKDEEEYNPDTIPAKALDKFTKK